MNDNKPTWGLEESDEFFQNCSKAFAILASGVVTAILPEGQDGNVELPAGSFFTLYELPILKDRSKEFPVTKIVGIVGNTAGTAPTDAGKDFCF